MTVDADRAAREVLDAAEKLSVAREMPLRDGWKQHAVTFADDDFTTVARSHAPLLAAEVLRLRGERNFWRALYVDDVCPDEEAVAALDRESLKAGLAALASSPDHDVARYTAAPSARGDTAPEEPR